MRNSPVLASRAFPKGWEGHRTPQVLRVEGGLNFIKGNSKPYFSLTYTQHRKGFPDHVNSCGADHDHILKYFPQFADIAALHLSDVDGVPMHVEGNGWYAIAGALGGMGERYHYGNNRYNFPLPADRINPAESWKTTEYRKPTKAECLQRVADFCRIPLEEARAMCGGIIMDEDPRAAWRVFYEALRPRWKEQADSCMAKHGLVVYGDTWPPEAESLWTAWPATPGGRLRNQPRACTARRSSKSESE